MGIFFVVWTSVRTLLHCERRTSLLLFLWTPQWIQGRFAAEDGSGVTSQLVWTGLWCGFFQSDLNLFCPCSLLFAIFIAFSIVQFRGEHFQAWSQETALEEIIVFVSSVNLWTITFVSVFQKDERISDESSGIRIALPHLIHLLPFS